MELWLIEFNSISLKNQLSFQLPMKKLLVFLAILFLAGCIKPPVDQVKFYDITEYDILDMIDKNLITGAAVTVEGVKLGDSLPQVVSKLGAPQYIDEYHDVNIVNIQYNDDDGKSMFVFHLRDDKVARMTIKPAYNVKLVGKTDMRKWHLHNITLAFGKPDVTYDSSYFRVYEYHDKSMELFHRRKRLMGFSFVDPSVYDEEDIN